MELMLENKVFIVTGGASGIGLSIVKNLLKEGAIVCTLDNNREAQTYVANEVNDSGNKLIYIVTELTDKDQCVEAFKKIIDKFEHINGLVNNAGINDGVSLENGNYQKFIESLDKNVGHYVTAAELSLPFLKKTGGVIVNICSKTAETGQGGTSGMPQPTGHD
jgi:L-fucose dehydrogenase